MAKDTQPVEVMGSNAKFFMPSGDGLHPNDAGHKILADKILAFLNTL